ncbi:unnamed protein product [Adineta ricciae]|uniref:F-box domain-containing protein n=1 Tax=Adineta ricciae TaxID=249248 RepID=A0A815YUW5_ADIRI|nr:unnamed protein product [Adineta ricciae]
MRLTVLDLPNEILCVIFHKLDIINVFYSFMSINERLDRLALDPFYIRKLIVTTKSFSDNMCLTKDEIVDKLCGDIIPQIHDQVNKLFVEQHLLQRVLHAGSYPRLNSLSLIDFQPRTLLKILTDDALFRNLLSEQIVSLQLDLVGEEITPGPDILLAIFVLIVSLCKHLSKLSFRRNRVGLLEYIFHFSSIDWESSTLTSLKINVETFDDCLHLLDGRLNNLSRLTIFVVHIKCSRVNQTTFSINTSIIKSRKRLLSSREDMKLSFIRKEYGPVGLYIETPKLKWRTIIFHHLSYPDVFQSRCHIYSLPYHFYDFYFLNNAFPDGLFNNVRNLSMTENRPFVANLFKIISESFPLLVALDIFNLKSSELQQDPTICISFPYLEFLGVANAHLDYIRQFLIDKLCNLPRLTNLYIRYEPLALVTINFTKNQSNHQADDIYELLGQSINQLVKYFDEPEKKRGLVNHTNLMQ